MYELKPYKSQIENYFGSLIDKYSLSVIMTNHVVQLKGDKSTFEITTGQYYLDLQFVFKNNEEPYNEISKGLFEFSIIIKNYCQDLFDGTYFSKNC